MVEGYPYDERQIVWGHDLRMHIASERTEDWYGLVGFYRRAGGDLTRAVRDMDGWNPWTRDLIKRGMVVIDCGANEGWTTCLFAKQVGPNGKVLAIEPDPKNVELIKRNLVLNDLNNVDVIQRAAAGRSGQILRFCDERVNTVGIIVETIALDDLAEYRPSVVKIDVEGYELEVLRGASKILVSGPALELEMHVSADPAGVNMLSQYGFSPLDVLKILRDNRYNAFQDGRSISLDQVPNNGSVWCTRGETVIHAVAAVAA